MLKIGWVGSSIVMDLLTSLKYIIYQTKFCTSEYTFNYISFITVIEAVVMLLPENIIID